jgi:hypothetical protein
VQGNIDDYISALDQYFGALPAQNAQRREYERFIGAYRQSVEVEGAGRTANVKDIRNLRQRRDAINSIRRRIDELKALRGQLFDEGRFGGDPEVDAINKTITALATNTGVTRGLDREGDSDYEESIDTQRQPYHIRRQNPDDESLVMGSRLDDSSDSDWSGEGRSGGHWTNRMLPHLKKELQNYNKIIHHLGIHLGEKGMKDPKDIVGFHYYTKEADRIRKLMKRI